MSLNPHQFDDIWKGTSRHDKRNFGGERFVRVDRLKELGIEHETEAEWIAKDGYGLEATPVGGLRSVFGPSGEWIADVESHKRGVQEIQEHRKNNL